MPKFLDMQEFVMLFCVYGAASPEVWASGLVFMVSFLLMGRAEKIVDGLYGIERRNGHLYKCGVPVAHGAVPQTGKLQRAEFLAVR